MGDLVGNSEGNSEGKMTRSELIAFIEKTNIDMLEELRSFNPKMLSLSEEILANPDISKTTRSMCERNVRKLTKMMENNNEN